MTKAQIHFADNTPDQELHGLVKIEFKNGDSKWTYIDPKGNGLKTSRFKVEKLAYIQIGVH